MEQFHLIYCERGNGSSTCYFDTLLQAVAGWSALKERDIEFAYISHYTDGGHPGVLLMDMHFNPFADGYSGAFLDLK